MEESTESSRIRISGPDQYPEGIRFAFGKATPQHIANVGVSKSHATINRVERLNGTLRERVKVQMGLKAFKTPLAERQRIHYNFVKPHAALEGKTPAESAGMGFRGITSGRNALTTRSGTAN